MKINRKSLVWIAMSLLVFSSCSSDDNIKKKPEGAKQQYIVAASSGENDYLVGTQNLENTIDATSSNAVQAPGSRSWFFVGDKVAYGFIYNQTDPSTTASYILNKEGEIEQRNELALKVGVHTRGIVNGQLILGYSDRNRPPKEGQPEKIQKAYFFEVNPNNDAVRSFEVPTKNLLGNGEFAYFTDIAEYEGNMIAGARSLKNAKFESDYFNTTYVVMFNPDFTVKKVIKDTGRTGFVAGQYRSQGETGLEVVDNGDLYVFSSGQTNYASASTSNIASGVLKINKGTTEFDNEYFFNITDASGGYNLFRTYYVGGDKFIVNMYNGKGDKATFGVSADRFAMVDVVKKEFQWINGIPKAAGGKGDKFSIGKPYIDKANSRIIAPITDSEGTSYLYEISTKNTEAKKLGKIVGERAKAIGRLQAK